MKQKTRNIIFIFVGALVCLIFYGRHNFQEDKQILLQLRSRAGNGDVKYVLDKMEEPNQFSNPIIYLAHFKWKQEMYDRFITNEEVIENTSGNKMVNDISNIYRTYWRVQLLNENSETRTDKTLYNNLSDYLIANQLTTLTKDSLLKIIKHDVELTTILKDQGYKTHFLLRNGFQDVLIWDEETTKNYTVVLPKDTVETKVIFIESYHLNGYDHYATFGSSSIGGWAIKEAATLYCNKAEYNLSSEKFEVSYLKHETIHFTDLNDYPNLSSTDLEYRAKLIELMYCTKESIYDRVAQFINGSDSTNRQYSHPYANYILIKNLSELVFNTDYESDHNKWKEISVEKINNAAVTLYKTSERLLQKDNSLTEVI